MPLRHVAPGVIYVIDTLALGTIVGSIFTELPTIAAGMAAVWYGISIADAIRRWFRKE